MKKLYGVICAMTTPFDEHDKVDVPALAEFSESLVKRGVHCLYPAGTTGEMLLMTPEERELVAETVVKQVAGRAVVYVHVGAMTTKETIRLAQHACKIGADGIGVVTPSFFGLTDRAMIQYYQDVSASIPEDFPMYLYAIPQCACNDLKPEVVREIARTCKNVVGIKYSYPDMHRLKEYVKINNHTFSVLFGADRLFLPALVAGDEGLVSGCVGSLPEHFIKVYEAFKKGDLKTAQKEQLISDDICTILKAGADMSVFKTAMGFIGLKGGHVRKPLLDITEAEKEKLHEDLKPYLEELGYK